MSNIIMIFFQKRLRKLEEEKEMVSMIKNKFRLVNVKQKTKQIASLKLKMKIDLNKKIKKNWDKIMNIVYGTKKMSNKYLKAYGELGTLLEIVLNLSLDDN